MELNGEHAIDTSNEQLNTVAHVPKSPFNDSSTTSFMSHVKTCVVSENPPIRVLICGDVEGQFDSLALSLTNVNRKQGPFHFAICLGNFLGNQCDYKISSTTHLKSEQFIQETVLSTTSVKTIDKDYLIGTKQFPLHVYFIDSSHSTTGEQLRRDYLSGYQFSSSLEFIGGFGIRLIHGLQICYLSGCYDARYFFDEDDDEENINVLDSSLSIPKSSTHLCNTLSHFSSPFLNNNGLTELSDLSESSQFNGSPHPLCGKRYFTGPKMGYYCRSLLQKLKELGSQFIGQVDLFLSCEWPAGFDETLNTLQKQDLLECLRLGQQIFDQTTNDILDDPYKRSTAVSSSFPSSPAVSELIEFIEPRFHVASGSGIFYQRPPFKTSNYGYASKFIGLGRVVSDPTLMGIKQRRYLHALILKPLQHVAKDMLLAIPSSSTPSPYFALYNPKASIKCLEHSVLINPIEYPDVPNSSSHRLKRFRDSSQYVSLNNSINVSHSEPSSVVVHSSDQENQTNHALMSTILTHSPSHLKRLCVNTSSFVHSETTPHSNVKEIHRRFTSPIIPEKQSSMILAPNRPTQLPACTTNCVFVSNIPYDVDNDSFMEIMTSFGPITNALVPRTPDGKSSGRAWITYKSLEDAEKTVAANEQLQSGGRLLKIQYSHSIPPSLRQEGRLQRGYMTEDLQRSQHTSRIHSKLKRQSPTQAIDVRPHSECWFCLANPKCEKRLIVSIGEKVYIALAKGGMVPQHVLIIPVTHFPNFVFCPPDVGTELELYISALRECYKSQGLDMIVYERYFPMKLTTGMHMQLQAIPIESKYSTFAVQLFQQRANRAGITLSQFLSDQTISALRRRVQDHIQQPYFYIELPGNDKDEIQRWMYTCSSPNDQKLPFNFGREVIAELMELPRRATWQDCVESQVIETQYTKDMQTLFLPFQPKT